MKLKEGDYLIYKPKMKLVKVVTAFENGLFDLQEVKSGSMFTKSISYIKVFYQKVYKSPLWEAINDTRSI